MSSSSGTTSSLILNSRVIALEKWGDEKHQKYGLLRGLDQLFQCVGSILVAPLIRRFPIRNILICAAGVFGFLSAILMVVDVSTGGRIKIPDDPELSLPTDYHGKYSPNVMFPVVCASGIVYGMVELIRRVIPRDIVGGDIGKLQQMDALVSYPLTDPSNKNSYFTQVGHGIMYFGLAISEGASIIFSNRKFIWLPIGYSLALYGHRYLENGILPIISEDIFHDPAYSRILVCGSNLGELVGALTVFLFGNMVPSPIPWLRLDACLLLLTWVLPFYRRSDPTTHTRKGPPIDAKWVWRLTPLLIPISFGWAAGDVSLAAYIQASLTSRQKNAKISSLGSVMAFLYSTYIIMFAVMSPALGVFADKNDDPRATVLCIGAVQFTVLAGVLLGSTFVPEGA
ncbi:hypothetical protein Q9L58_006138 [Maublancomyces gigas]|uniref:Uncharacterized protein n=1 Tax=Discina gigas TaxID=1032678 RepID=A0ABR3GG69_9PEZI